MFKFTSKADMAGRYFTYYFDILDSDYFKIGVATIEVGLGRHEASFMFDEGMMADDVTSYIEDFRELLDSDLITIDEPHDEIVLAEILYNWSNEIWLRRQLPN